MKKLKIGIFMDDYYPSINGVVLVMDNYARRLSKYADVTVVVPYIDKNYVDDFPYKIKRVNSIKLGFINYSLATANLNPKTIKELANEKFDIIHIHSPFTVGKLGLAVGKKLDIPVIATMHTRFDLEFKRYAKSDLITKELIKVIMKVFNDCYKCYAVNKKIAEIFYGFGAKQMPGVLPNGTELTLIEDYKKNINKVNKRFKIKRNETVLLFLGRINILKNILFIIDVLDVLKKKNIEFKMMFVGPEEDGVVLKNKIRELGLEDNIIMTGKICDRELIKAIYARAKLFIFPSLYDASSLVQIEAASQKTPTIFIEGAPTADSVINNQNGFLAPNDKELFAEKIIEVLNNKELYDKVSEGAYNEIYKNWDTLTNDLYQTYNEIIDEYKKK